MANPIVKYKDFQGWIPETDIDGVDAGTKFLSEAINIDFENGFLRPCVSPVVEATPTEMDADLAAGYNIVSAKMFTHSTQGLCTFYVLFKAITGTYYYKFYLTDSAIGATSELTINNIGSNPTLSSVPSNISYDFVADQLKINLNVTGTLLGIATTMMNLTLVRLLSPTQNDCSTGSAGWYLVPRWLGWQVNNPSYLGISNIVGGVSKVSLAETCNDIIPESWLEIVNNIEMFNTKGWKTIYPTSAGVIRTKSTNSFCNIKNIILLGMSIGSDDSATVKINRITTGEEVYSSSITHTEIAVYIISQFDTNLTGNDYQITITITGTFILDNFIINGFAYNEYCVLGKYADGQRALLSGTTSSPLIVPDLYDSMYLRVYGTHVDYRLAGYEVYIKINEIFYLVSEIDSNSGWSADAYGGIGWYKQLIVWTENDTLAVTLNFNYGLGATVRVDTQRTIYCETSYRNRTYTVNGSFRVYQSQIAGNARHQPDSFPYDEANFYGFFELPRSENAMGIVVTPLEELAVLCLNGKAYVYYMQISQGASYKRTKAINGNAGLTWTKSLVKDISGNPNGNIIAWADYNGIYAYAGGVDAPIDLTIKANIKNWWLSQRFGYTYDPYGMKKSNVIGFYYPSKNEIWFADGDSGGYNTILIYEIDYGRFKKYQFPFTIIDFIGVKDNKIYMLSNVNTVYYYMGEAILSASDRLIPIIVTHYTTGMVATQFGTEHLLDESEYKILQELYVQHNIIETKTALTSGSLVVGKTYTIDTYSTDDDFTNVGASSNAVGIIFVATGTTPAHWMHSSSVREVSVWYMQYLVDGDSGINTTVKFRGDKLYEHIFSQLNYQFHKVKLKLSIPSPNIDIRSSIREFGFSFSTFSR
ncbi:MAG: hypothetical protein ACYC2U_04730, partial [Candidatus Amoebophilus sp.]